MHADVQYAAQAAQAAFDLVDRLERELSRFLPNSDITRINQLAAGEQHARRAVDARVPRDRAAHVRSDRRRVRRLDRHRAARRSSSTPTSRVVRATTRGVQVDLGGIGKGYAVDLMAELLEEWGLERSLVHGGFSSVLALEPPAGHDGWPLTLSDPRDPSRVLARLSVRQTALGASGVAQEAITSWIRARAAGARAARGVGRGAPTPRVSGPRVRAAASRCRRRSDRCADDGVHAAAPRRSRGAVPEQPGRRGVDPRGRDQHSGLHCRLRQVTSARSA